MMLVSLLDDILFIAKVLSITKLIKEESNLGQIILDKLVTLFDYDISTVNISSFLYIYLQIIYKSLKSNRKLLIWHFQHLLMSNSFRRYYCLKNSDDRNFVTVSFSILQSDTAIYDSYNDILDKDSSEYIGYISNNDIKQYVNIAIDYLLSTVPGTTNYGSHISEYTRKVFKFVANIARTQGRMSLLSNKTIDISNYITNTLFTINVEELDDKTQNNIATTINTLRKVQNHVLTQWKNLHDNRSFGLACNILCLPYLDRNIGRKLFLDFLQHSELTTVEPILYLQVIISNLLLLKTTSNALFEVIVSKITNLVTEANYKLNEDVVISLSKFFNKLITVKEMKNYVYSNIESLIKLYNWLQYIENESFSRLIERLVVNQKDELNRFSEKIVSILITNINNVMASSNYYLTYANLHALQVHVESLEFNNNDFLSYLTDQLINIYQQSFDSQLRGIVLLTITAIIRNQRNFNLLSYVWKGTLVLLNFHKIDNYDAHLSLLSVILSQINHMQTYDNLNLNNEVIKNAHLDLHSLSMIIEVITLTGLGNLNRNNKCY